VIHINMVKVDVAKFLVSFFTFCIISSVLYRFNKDAILFTEELFKEAFGGEVAEEEEEAFCAKCAEKDAGNTD